MGDGKHRVGSALRFLASGGWAQEDPDVLADLLRQAHQLAAKVLAAPTASDELHAAAREFLTALAEDTRTDL